jgi:hypothetical protein
VLPVLYVMVFGRKRAHHEAAAAAREAIAAGEAQPVAGGE